MDADRLAAAALARGDLPPSPWPAPSLGERRARRGARWVPWCTCAGWAGIHEHGCGWEVDDDAA